MQRFVSFIVVLLSLSAVLATGQIPAARAKEITLENSQLRVVLSAQNGTLISIDQKKGNLSYLGSSSQSGWFRVQIPLADWEGHFTASKDLPAMSVAKKTADSVEFQATSLSSKEGKYKISARLSIRLEGDNIICFLNLRNDSQRTIDRISFPIVDVPPASDGNESIFTPNSSFFQLLPLRLLFSSNDLQTTHNPFDSLDPVDLRAWFANDPKIPVKGINYPMDLPTAWLTYTGDKKGLGFDVRTKDFEFQKFTVERRLFRDTVSPANNKHDYELGWNWYPLVKPGTTWQSPEIFIKCDQGDWHAIAKQHRDWLRTWITRPKPPKELQQSIGWISRGIQSFDQIPAIAKSGVEIGAPYFIVYGWGDLLNEGGMTYDSYPKTEFGGVEALRRNLEAAKKLGSFPLAWFNGTTTVQSDMDHMLVGREWAAVDRWGGLLLDGRWSLFSPGVVTAVNNSDQWFEMDPSTAAKSFLLDAEKRFIEYGFVGNEMDQAHKNYLSYRVHADGTGPELAFSKGYGDFFAQAQKIIKTANPAGIIVGENPSELINQYVDSTWIFEGGPLNVATLTTWRYSWPWMTVPTRAVPSDMGHANRAFMMNAPLDIFDDLSGHPEYADHLKQLHGLKMATSDFFYQGEFSDQEGFTLVSPQKDVMAKSYRELAGAFTAVVVINSGSTVREATIRPDADIANEKTRHFYLNGRTAPEPASGELHLTLPPYDVQILSFER
jgi:hypothetical protein